MFLDQTKLCNVVFKDLLWDPSNIQRHQIAVGRNMDYHTYRLLTVLAPYALGFHRGHYVCLLIFSAICFQWEVVQRTLNGSQFYTYSVCNVGESEQDNWLRTTFIQRGPSASRVFVELKFIVRDCNSFDASLTCKETFNLFTSESDADVGTTFRKGQFKKVATIAPDEISKNELHINTDTRVVENLSLKGFYLAFQDIGACIALLSVRVFYKTCSATVNSLASFPETVAGGENQALREVSGVCVENAISEELPRIHCTVDGEWVVPVGQCQCKPGYEEVKDSCQGKGMLQNLWYL